MKRETVLRAFFVLIGSFSYPILAHAETVECSVTVEFQEQSPRIVTKSGTAQSALTKAIQTGCTRICECDEVERTCAERCFAQAHVHAIQCFNEEDTLYQPDLSKARHTLLHPAKQATKDAPEVRSDYLIPSKFLNSQRGAHRSSKALLFTKWQGEVKKDRKTRKFLLYKDGKRKELLLTNSVKRPPLLEDKN